MATANTEKEVVREGLINLALRGVGIAAKYAFTVVATQLFGKAVWGDFSLAYNMVFLAMIVARYGLDMALIRLIASHLAIRRAQAIHRVARVAFRLSGVFGLGLALLLCAFALWGAQVVFPASGVPQLLLIMAWGVVPFALLSLISEAQRGLGHIKLYTTIQNILIYAVGIIVLPVAYVWWPSSQVLACSFVAGLVATWLFGLWSWQRSLHKLPAQPAATPYAHPKRLLAMGFPMFTAGVFFLALGFADTFVIGMFCDSAQVGLYDIAVKLALLLQVPLLAFGGKLAPQTVSLLANSQTTQLQQVVAKANRMVLALAAVGWAVLLVLGHLILGIFGQGFADAYPLLVVLATSQLVNAATGNTDVIMQMGGMEKDFSRLVAWAFVLNMAANFALVPVWGTLGAAAAFALTTTFLKGMCVYTIHQRIGIWSLPVTGGKAY